MRKGSRTDSSLSTDAIFTTATPEYLFSVIFIIVFASDAVGLKWFRGSYTSAVESANFKNFFLAILTIALCRIGYIARMTRASMAEVRTAQYIRTARLKGVVFVNSPTVYRIVRSFTMDIKTRDYVAAAQIRGQGPCCIML